VQKATASGGKAGKGKKAIPPNPLGGAKERKVAKNPFFEKTKRNFRIGGDIQPKRDLTRFVKWPKYVQLQRQRRILLKRLKVPPALNHFTAAIDKNQASTLLRLLSKYKPETRTEKHDRLLKEAERREATKEKTTANSKKPVMIKFGLNHVTDLVEIKKAKLVVIAHDVQPIELVCWLPALCRKKDIPYCIVKGRSRLGQLVHQKNAACIAVESVRKEDMAEFETLCKNFRAQFNDNVELRRRWGGGIMGHKSQHMMIKKEKLIALEQAKKFGLTV